MFSQQRLYTRYQRTIRIRFFNLLFHSTIFVDAFQMTRSHWERIYKNVLLKQKVEKADMNEQRRINKKNIKERSETREKREKIEER